MKAAGTYESVSESGTMIRAHPAVGIQADAWRRAKLMMTEFGMTPASRAKVSVTDAGEVDPLAAWGARHRMTELAWMLLAFALLAEIPGWIWLADRRVIRRRRRRDLTFLSAAFERTRPHKRVRPKADPHIQRRRYAR